MINLTKEERARLYALRDAAGEEDKRLFRRTIAYFEDLEATLAVIHYHSRRRGG